MQETLEIELQPQTAASDAAHRTDDAEDPDRATLVIERADTNDDLPDWARREALELFFHEQMDPWHDELVDVSRGLDYAFSDIPGMGGFVILAGMDGHLVGAVTMLRTGMKGYIPENLLLFICVDPVLRGCGVGKALIKRAVGGCEGAVKLHVEPDNPARRLYERCGFEAKYVEMRLKP